MDYLVAPNPKLIMFINCKLKTLVFLFHKSKNKRDVAFLNKKLNIFYEFYFQVDFCKIQLMGPIKFNLTVEKNKKYCKSHFDYEI